MARKKKDRDETGKLVDVMVDEVGPASKNNRLRKFVEKVRKR